MIVGVAFVPETPLLVPDVAQGAAAELDELRTACRTAIARAAAAAEHVVIVGTGPVTRRFEATARGTLAPFGVPLAVALGSDGGGGIPAAGSGPLPPALTVGGWLVRDALGAGSGAVGVAVGDDPLPALPPGPTALVVVGDGSARRSPSAPGYLDERAAGFDAAVAGALRAGVPPVVDAGLAAELLAGGVRAWNASAAVLDGRSWEAELLYDDAPYGVGYFVAVWRAHG